MEKNIKWSQVIKEKVKQEEEQKDSNFSHAQYKQGHCAMLFICSVLFVGESTAVQSVQFFT